MTRRGYKIPPARLSPFLQTCLAIVFMWLLYVAGSFIVAGLINLIGSVV